MRNLLLVICLLALSVFASAQTATPPALGDGTVGNPYQIATLNNLYWISQTPGKWNSHYIQTANINASATSTWNSGEGWQPIGYGSGGPNQFRGTYNGQNFTISGLYINRPSTSTVGLFGSTYIVTISNLGLVNVNITGNGRVGALVGQHDAMSKITNCYSTGTVSGNTEVGGLIGYVFQSAEVNKSYSTATVTANTISGGLAGGLNSGGIINECYATGNVTNLSNGVVAGGLVGSALLFSQINKSYARGNVNAGQPIGGLVGSISSSFVAYSYSTGLLTSASPYRGGLVGQALGSAEVNNSFWDITTSTAATSSGGLGRSTGLMKTYSTFFMDGWDYIGETTNGTNDFWGMNPTNNNGYPFLAWQGFVNQVTPVLSTLSAQDITGEAFTGRGNIISLGSGITQHGITWNTTGMPNITTDSKTEEGSMSQTGTFSSTINGLNPKTTYYFRAYAVNAFGVSYGEEYTVTTILEGDGTIGNPYLIATWEDIQWMVGQSYNATVLAGHFLQVANIDAGGATMSPIGRRSNGTTAIFDGVYDGNGHTISNVVISYPGQNSIGFIGSINGGEVKRLGLINFTVSGSNYVGALSGGASNAIITECYATGVSITAIGWGGGLIGTIGTNTIVSKCYTTGNITGTGVPLQSGYIGGLVGRMGVAEVNNSYTHVHVAGSSEYSGGFTGFIDGGTIINSYSTGTVTMQAYFTSGFVGWDLENTVIGSFWDIESSNRLNSRVGIGLTTAEMTQYLTFYEAGWDMVLETANGTDDIWGINPAENNGYPFLMWQGLTPDVTYPPSVTTLAASNVTNDNATLNGNLTRLGIPSPTNHGFVWNTTGNPNIAVDNVINLGAASSTGAFNYELTGIEAISTYYFRAFVTTDLGTFTGNVQSFKTVLEGSGTELDPYVIVSLSDLQWLMNNSVHWNKYFEQAADIDASLTSQWSSGAGFTPIGASGVKFTGHYNGNGHTISGLYINRPASDYQGLFGYIQNATISNLSILNANIYANNYVGIIAGYADGSTITNCNTSGTVNGLSGVGGIAGRIDLVTTVSNCNSSASVNTSSTGIASGGGIVGSSYGSSTIQSCTFNGEYTGHTGERHGGIVGFVISSLIVDCETNATITASGNSVGGIVGSLGGTLAEIRNCIALGTTQGVNEVGGLVGRLSTNYPLMINSQSSGNVIGNNNVGGLVGALRATGRIEDSWSNAHVTGASRVGGAIGEAKDLNVLVLNSYSTGTVEGTTIIGGFVGAVETSAVVQTSYSTATVIASATHAGGFVGRVESLGKVFNSYALGSVTGTSTIGGFAGSINNTGTQVTHCFAAGKTTGTTTTNITGFVGQSYQATILYNLFDKETTGLISGGAGIGKTNTEMRTLATFLDTGWDFIGETTNGTVDNWGINGSDNQGYPFLAWQGYEHSIPAIISTLVPTNILGTSASLNGTIIELNGHTLISHGFTWNTTGNPNITDDSFFNLGVSTGLGNYTYALTGLTPGTTYYARTYSMSSVGKMFYGNTIPFVAGPAGLGTELQPYLISSLNDYIWLINNPNHWDKHYLQTNDIDASATSTWNGVSGSTPIGNATTSFTGVYDGNNYSITNLYIKRISTSFIGMFGNINNATIKNVVLDNVYMQGSSDVGGLVANGAGNTEITNCRVNGEARGSGSRIGGLTGLIAGVVNNCHFEGYVGGTSFIGGLIGTVLQCTVLNSSAIATVNSNSWNPRIGGFAGTTSVNATIKQSWCNSTINTSMTTGNTQTMGGFIGQNGGVVEDCYAMGSVTAYLAATNIGGFIGYNSNTLVNNSYSTVQINGTGTSVGGAIGFSTVSVGNLLWDVTTSGVATSAGGSNVVGKTTTEMNDLNTYLVAGFDFLSESINGVDDFWGYNPEQNNSYPFLAWQVEFEHKYSPSITINNVSDITSVSATINAVINHLGDPQAVEHGFCWNNTGNPSLTDNKVSFGEPAEAGAFSYLLANLKPNEQYFVKAYITNENATYFGNEQSFNTPVKEIFFTGSFIANNKVYDGTTVAQANIDNLVADGVVLSASGVVISAINFQFESSNVGNNKTVIMSGVTLDGVDKDRYVVNLAGAPTSMANITPKQITVSGAIAQNKVYNGTTEAIITGATLQGVVGADNVSINGSIGLFQNKNVGVAKTVNATITITGTQVGNYTLTQPTGLTANIEARELTLPTAAAQNKTYDGNTNATLTNLAFGNKISGDVVEVLQALAFFQTKNVGTNIPVSTDVSITGSDANNYYLTQPSGLNANIVQKELIVINPLAANKVYDGELETSISGTLSGVIGDDNVIFNETIGLFANKNVGNNKPVTASISITGDDSGNYYLTQPLGITANITPKSLNITGALAQNKVYDGTTSATVTGATLNGLIGADDVLLDQMVANFNNSNVGIGKPVSTSITIAGLDYANYNLIQPTGLTANIIAKELTVSGASVSDKVYNGTAAATITGATLSGIVGGDNVSLSNHTAGLFTQITVGTAIPVMVSMTLTGTNQGNYQLIQPTLTGNINYRPLAITPNSFNKTMGIEYLFQGDEFTANNLVAGDNVTWVELISDGAEIGATVGPYSIGITPNSEIGVGLTNYSITYNTGTLTVVDQTELFLVGITVSNKTYDGNNVAIVTSWGTLTGVDPIDDVVIDVSAAVALFSNKNVGNGKSVTISGLNLTGPDAIKYYINNHSSTANILVRNLSLTNFEASDKIYDATVNATGTGFDDDRVLGDDITFSYSAQFVNKHAGNNKPVNFTGISVNGGADAGNYTLANNVGVAYATILVKEVTIGGSFTVFDKEFDGTSSATIDQNNLVLSDVITNDDVALLPVAVFTNANIGEDIQVILSLTSSLIGDDNANYLLNLSEAPTTTAAITEPTIPQYTLTVTAVGNGNVEVNGIVYSEMVYVSQGTIINLEAIADAGWQFVGWSGDLVLTENAVELTMDGNKSITATFSEVITPTFTLTISIVGNGSVEVNETVYNEPLPFDQGTVLSLEALADASWQFDGWSGDLVAISNTETLTMDADKVITATFSLLISVDSEIASTLTVYPNPFGSSINISNTNLITGVKVTNLVGQIVKDINVFNAEDVNIQTDDLIKGVYLVIVDTAKGERIVRRIVKE